jgi:hypothetical protein
MVATVEAGTTITGEAMAVAMAGVEEATTMVAVTMMAAVADADLSETPDRVGASKSAPTFVQ